MTDQTKYKCNIYINIIKAAYLDLFELKIILMTLRKAKNDLILKRTQFWGVRKNGKHFIINHVI